MAKLGPTTVYGSITITGEETISGNESYHAGNLSLSTLGYTGALNANYYTHPTNNGNKHIPANGSDGQFLGYSTDGTAKWVDNPNTDTDKYGGWDVSVNAGDETTIGSGDLLEFQAGNNVSISLSSNIITISSTDTNTWRSVHNTPNSGSTAISISSNWAYDHVASFSTGGSWASVINKYPGKITSSGVLEVARYIDFHTNSSTQDYDVRLNCESANMLKLDGGSFYATAGAITASHNISAYSDISLKDDIKIITNPVEKVKQIRGVSYNRNDIENNPRQSGVIAQEVEKVLPEVVLSNEDGIKSVAYGNMVGLLIEAIKEQQTQIDKLEKLVEQLSENTQ